MEEPIITGIAAEKNEAKITVGGVPDVPGVAAHIFEVVAKTNANIDIIVQNVSAADTNRTDIPFTVPAAEGRRVIEALEKERDGLELETLQDDDQRAKVAGGGCGCARGLGRRRGSPP